MCLLVLGSIWANDGFAYLGGSSFRQAQVRAPHLAQRPGSVACGMLASVIFWVLIVVFVPNCGFGYVWAVISGIVVGYAENHWRFDRIPSNAGFRQRFR